MMECCTAIAEIQASGDLVRVRPEADIPSFPKRSLRCEDYFSMFCTLTRLSLPQSHKGTNALTSVSPNGVSS